MNENSSRPSSSGDMLQSDEEPSSRSWLKRLVDKVLSRGDETDLRRSLAHAITSASSDSEDDSVHALGDDERMMLNNILSNGNLRVDDVMVPRADIISFDIADGFSELITLFCNAEHSRLPVYRESLDDVIGMVHIKDVIKPLSEQKDNPPTIAALLRSVLYVPPSMRILDLLTKMRAGRIHMAMVIDEFGGTDGLVTIEDLVEQFVGEIEDEHDELEPDPLRLIGPGQYEADARLSVPDLEKELHLDLLTDEEEEDIDTLGGLVVWLAGKVPTIGDSLEHPLGLRFEVVDGDPRRLKKIRIHILEQSS